MTIEVDTVTAPAHWANYLVNGDASGLEPDEKATADAWQRSIEPWYVVSTTNNAEPRFTWNYRIYDGSWVGGDVLDYVVHRTEGKSQ